MIPTIGMMIGCYIFTRMLALCMDSRAHFVVKLFAGISMAVSGFGAALLLVAGTPGLPQ